MRIATTKMSSRFRFAFFVILHAESLLGKTVNQKPLRLKPLTKCTYDYKVTVYTVFRLDTLELRSRERSIALNSNILL